MTQTWLRFSGLFRNIRPEWFFVTVGIVFGMTFLLLTPPFQTPDEPVHFFRAYQVSEGNLLVDSLQGMNGGKLPTSLAETVEETTTAPVVSFHDEAKYDIHKTYKALSILPNDNHTKAYRLSATALYPPIVYIPQAFAIFVTRLLGWSPVLMVYAGRLANLVTWLLLAGLSIKILPRKKWVLVFVGLLPMSIFQAVSLSADVFTVGLTILFISYVLHLRESPQPVSRRKLVLLLLIGTLMAIAKPVMFVFLPLVFLLPDRVLGGKLSLYKKLTIGLLPFLVFVVWYLIASPGSKTTSPANGSDAVAQLRFIMKSPQSLINVLWNTFFFTWGDSITGSVIGIFGWMDTPLAEWIIVVGYVTLAFIMFAIPNDQDTNWLTSRQKVIVALVMVAYWAAVSTALYMFYTPVGFKIVVGLQGRYFLPLLLPLALIVGDSQTVKTTPRAYRITALAAPVFLLICSAITIGFRYYVHNV